MIGRGDAAATRQEPILVFGLCDHQGAPVFVIKMQRAGSQATQIFRENMSGLTIVNRRTGWTFGFSEKSPKVQKCF
jgi:hypothetical protein